MILASLSTLAALLLTLLGADILELRVSVFLIRFGVKNLLLVFLLLGSKLGFIITAESEVTV